LFNLKLLKAAVSWNDKVMKEFCYGLSVCASSSSVHPLPFNHQCNGMRVWDFWKCFTTIIWRSCLSLGGVVSVPCHKDVIDHSFSSLIPVWLQERMTQSKRQQVQNGDRGFKLFFSFKLISWAQVRSQCFSPKAV
jgi:hypothetical protein